MGNYHHCTVKTYTWNASKSEATLIERRKCFEVSALHLLHPFRLRATQCPNKHTWQHDIPCPCKQPRAAACPARTCSMVPWLLRATHLHQHNKTLQLGSNAVVVTCSCCSQPGDLEQQPVHLREIKLFSFLLYGTQCNIQVRHIRRTNGLLKRLWTLFLLQRSLALGGSGLITKLASTGRK